MVSFSPFSRRRKAFLFWAAKIRNYFELKQIKYTLYSYSERWAKDKRTIIIKIYPLNELIIKICFNRILSEYKVFFFDIFKENEF